MKFADVIIEELINIGIITDNSCVQSISFFPPPPYNQYDCSVRISCCDSISDRIRLHCSTFIDKCEAVGNYINIVFNLEGVLSRLHTYVFNETCQFGFEENKYTCLRVAIEHTSITPVYPINLATFRSSAIGEALKNLMLFWGACVNTHFFVEDLARQLDLLEYGFSKTGIELDELGEQEKVDHLLGRIFVLAYLESHPYSPAAEKLDDMFPYSRSAYLNSDLSDCAVFNQKEYLCERCMHGIKQTLVNTGIEIDYFDLESKFTNSIIPDAFKEPTIIQELLENSKKIPYYLRNCAYFSRMAGQYDHFFTVISDRQRATINDTLDALAENDNIHAIFFGDVLISDDDETNALDSIKEGTFHSVDQYISVMTDLYHVTSDVIIDALKYKILSTKLSKGCFIDDSNIDQYNEFFQMIQWLRSYVDNKTDCGLFVSSEDRTYIIQVVKRIIQFEEVFSKLQNDFSFHHLTDYVYTLYLELKTAASKCDAVNQNLIRSIVANILHISFKILDIKF